MTPKKPRKPVRRATHHAASAHHPVSTPWWQRIDRRIVIAALAVVLLGVVAFFPVALATDQPQFCATCHGMRPFYDAWQVGKHKDISCIDCHVDAGYPSRFLHKFAALQEVWDQFFAHAKFPNYNADMPDSRCVRCHPDVGTKPPAAGQFSGHELHLSRGVKCATCHATAGHTVTFAALDSAGVLNSSQVATGATYVGEQFSGAPGQHSALPGHIPVVCSSCHDQANLQCSFCHTPPPSHYGADCTLCHVPGVPFTQFTHRPIPAPHGIRNRACATCHPNGFGSSYCTCHHGHPPTGD